MTRERTASAENVKTQTGGLRMCRPSLCMVRQRAASSGAAGGMITLDDLTLIKKEDFNTLLNLINNAPDDAILA